MFCFKTSDSQGPVLLSSVMFLMIVLNPIKIGTWNTGWGFITHSPPLGPRISHRSSFGRVRYLILFEACFSVLDALQTVCASWQRAAGSIETTN